MKITFLNGYRGTVRGEPDVLVGPSIIDIESIDEQTRSSLCFTFKDTVTKNQRLAYGFIPGRPTCLVLQAGKLMWEGVRYTEMKITPDLNLEGTYTLRDVIESMTGDTHNGYRSVARLAYTWALLRASVMSKTLHYTEVTEHTMLLNQLLKDLREGTATTKINKWVKGLKSPELIQGCFNRICGHPLLKTLVEEGIPENPMEVIGRIDDIILDTRLTKSQRLNLADVFSIPFTNIPPGSTIRGVVDLSRYSHPVLMESAVRIWVVT